LRLAEYSSVERSNYQYVVIEVDEATTGIDRDLLVDLLHAENVLARRYFHPGVHRMEPYRSYFPHSHLLLPHTERLTHQVMSMPTGTGVDENDVAGVCALVKFAIQNGREITQRSSS